MEESRSKGKSFGLEREKLPDNSYLIPQMQKVPGPGFVDIFLSSMKTKKINSLTIASQWDRSLLILSRKSYPTKSPLGLELIKRSSLNLDGEDLLFLNSRTLHFLSFTHELKDLGRLRIVLAQAVIFKAIQWTEIASIFSHKERVMGVEYSQRQQEMYFGEKLIPQGQELMFKQLSLDIMEIATTIKPLESDYSY